MGCGLLAATLVGLPLLVLTLPALGALVVVPALLVEVVVQLASLASTGGDFRVPDPELEERARPRMVQGVDPREVLGVAPDGAARLRAGWVLEAAAGSWSQGPAAGRYRWGVDLRGPSGAPPPRLEVRLARSTGGLSEGTLLARSGPAEPAPPRAADEGGERGRSVERERRWRLLAEVPEDALPEGAPGQIVRSEVRLEVHAAGEHLGTVRLSFSRFVRLGPSRPGPRRLPEPERLLPAAALAGPEATLVAATAASSPQPAPRPGTCQVCGGAFEVARLRRCPACETLHHEECWDYAGGCATYGCRQRSL